MKPLSDKSTINFAESMETVFEDIREVSPTLFYGVPRIYEKINSNFNIALSEATNLSKFIYERALKTSLKRVELKMKNLIILRFGYNSTLNDYEDEYLTFGFGVKTKLNKIPINIDYSFQNRNLLNQTSTFGLSFSF